MDKDNQHPATVNRAALIRELKSKIQEANSELSILKTELGKAKTDEEKKTARIKHSELFAVITALEEKLKLTRMNKTGSAFFEFTPTGMNRRQKRYFMKNRHKIKTQKKESERDNRTGSENTTTGGDNT